MVNQNKIQFQVLIEEDKADGDFVAYIPALRLGVRGLSLEDVRENAKDLLLMEVEGRLREGNEIPRDNTATMETIHISLPVTK